MVCVNIHASNSQSKGRRILGQITYHICDDKQVIAIRLYMWIINQSKDGFII